MTKLKRMEWKESYSMTSDYTKIDKATVAKQEVLAQKLTYRSMEQ